VNRLIRFNPPYACGRNVDRMATKNGEMLDLRRDSICYTMV